MNSELGIDFSNSELRIPNSELTMRFLAIIILAIAVIAAAFHYAKPLPSTNFDESFLPKADYVKYVAAGNDASVAGLFWIKGLTELGDSFLSGKEYTYLSHVANLCTELDSLFYTPYYFVSAITPMDSKDTTDYVVMRRALKLYPDQWRLAVSHALRLSKGPYPNKTAAANVMRPYFDYPDPKIPNHIRTLYRSFELDTMQTEIALEADDATFVNGAYKAAYDAYSQEYYDEKGYSQDEIVKHLMDSPDRTVAFLASQLSTDERYDLSIKNLRDAMMSKGSWLTKFVPKAILVFQACRLENKENSLKESLREAQNEGDQAMELEIMTSLVRLRKAIKAVKVRLGREK